MKTIIKFIIYSDKTLKDKIIDNLSLYINQFLIQNKKLITNNENKSNNYPNEISMTYSNINIIKYILTLLKHNNDIFSNNKNISELLINLDKYIHYFKCNISDLLVKCIKNSTEELSKIDFTNYPNYDNENIFNPFVNHIIQFKNIFISMINCFEDYLITNIFNENLKIFLDKFESYIKNLTQKIKIQSDILQGQ